MNIAKDVLKPRLLLFLSVDVVGSTRFKNERADGVQPWLPFFVEFYQAFPELLSQRVASEKPPLSLSLWKSLGDELLFYAELKSQRDAVKLMEDFLSSLTEYRRILQQKRLPAYLNLKGTAWVAGFPVVNSIVLPAGKGKHSPDFIGPNIDIGFRLAKHSTPASLYVSVELACLLAHTNSEAFHLRFETTTNLKGVLKDHHYPLICIHQPEAIPTEEHAVRDATPPLKLKAYCKQFIEAHGRPLIYPFIAGDKDFSTRPPDYAKDLAAIGRIFDSLELSPAPQAEPRKKGLPTAPSSALKSKVSKFKF